MAVTQIIKLDLNNHKADAIILRVGESYTRKIVFIPGTYDGDEFTPTEFYGREEGPRAMFRLVKPDRTFVTQNLTVVHEEPDTGIYSFELVPDEYMSQVGGIGYYDLRINDSDTEEEFLYTVQGRVLIDDDMITDSMIESVAAANGLIFPDDFLTSADLSDYVKQEQLDDYATIDYVDTAIEQVDTMHNYSTTEKLVGKWIDDKDLYEKVLFFPKADLQNGTHNVNHNISDIDTIIYAYSYLQQTGNTMEPLPLPGANNDWSSRIYDIDRTKFTFNIGSSLYGALVGLYVIIQYTKTV